MRGALPWLVRYLLIGGWLFGRAFPGLASSALPTDSIGLVRAADAWYVRYRLAEGETPATVAARYQVNAEALRRDDRSGTVLVPCRRTHTLQPGETLADLAARFGVPLDTLRYWNPWPPEAGEEVVVADITPAPGRAASALVGVVRPLAAETAAGAVRSPTVTLRSDPLTTAQDSAALAAAAQPNADVRRVLVVPFDPYLYFSDADDEIAERSRVPRQQIRQHFRRRLNALIAPPGYEAIYLLGGLSPDTVKDLDRLYASVNYNYQDILYRDAEERSRWPDGIEVNKPDEATSPSGTAAPARRDRFAHRYFGVRIDDPAFFDYFGERYAPDYYVFINQFEVVTDYERCLDRATQNYQRYFLAHFSIFDRTGRQVAGNKVKVYYHSSTNVLSQIVSDNMQAMANAVMTALPRE